MLIRWKRPRNIRTKFVPKIFRQAILLCVSRCETFVLLVYYYNPCGLSELGLFISWNPMDLLICTSKSFSEFIWIFVYFFHKLTEIDEKKKELSFKFLSFQIIYDFFFYGIYDFFLHFKEWILNRKQKHTFCIHAKI